MAASNTRFTQNSLGQSKNLIDSDHGIYRDRDVVVGLGEGQTLTLREHQTTDFTGADFWTGIDLSQFQLAFADEFGAFDSSPDGSHGWRTTLDWGGANAACQLRGRVLFGFVGRREPLSPARRRSGHHRDARFEPAGPGL